MGFRKHYEIHFPYFFKEMIKEMDKHYPEKKCSYRNMSVEGLETLLRGVIKSYFDLDCDYPRKITQSVDIANLCAMLYFKLCGLD